MIPEWADMLGVLTVAAYLMGMGGITYLVWLTNRRTGAPWRTAAVLATVFALYLVGVGLDAVPSVTTVLTNGVGDIPPSASGRTALFAVWTWVLYAWMLARYRGLA